MLTTEQALAVADRRQRRGLMDAAAFGTAMGSPVRFLRHPRPAGAEFEAVMLDSSRTCATVSPRGELSWRESRRPRDPWAEAIVLRPSPPAAAPVAGMPSPRVRVVAAECPAPAPPAVAARAPAEAPGGAARCERRTTAVRLALGAHARAALTLEWGTCEQGCCRPAERAATDPGQRPPGLRAGRWHVTLVGAGDRPVVSLAVTRR